MSTQTSKDIRDAWAVTVNSPKGRIVIGHILSICGHGTDTWAATDRDTAYETGKRAVGLGIANMLNDIERPIYACVKSYKEAILRERDKERARQENSQEDDM